MTIYTLSFVACMLMTQISANIDTVLPTELFHLKFMSNLFDDLSKGLHQGTGTPVVGNDATSATACPYDDVITCDATYKYRSFDGSCNNLNNPFFGRKDTPFERLLTPEYEDGIEDIRVTPHKSSDTLIGPRQLSTEYHQASAAANLQVGVNHITMEFGQFVSHDVNRNTITRAASGGPLQCCNNDGTLDTTTVGCAPIPVPVTDPFFGSFGRLCLNFARALPDTDILCDDTYRQQRNRVTHFLDASTVYGSDKATADSLRTFSDGLLQTASAPQDGRELMLQSPLQNNFVCRAATGSNEFCFISGDGRVNQNPMLVSMHTIFLREHNRVARELKSLNPSWDDEKLYQESRRIVIAEYQHIVYGEYLSALLSIPVAALLGLLPKFFGYYNNYDPEVNPAVRNEFVAAAYRSGHSTIDSTISPGELLKNHFFEPSTIYDASKGIDFLVSNLVQNQQQTMDRLKTDQVTNHLFQFSDGDGGDLAATNIQRGRDHGLPSYNDMRELCGLPRATSFNAAPGGLEHHTADSANRLNSLYTDPDDIEAWTGMSSEMRITGGVFGPTAACITALQFDYLKRGDRFYYENDLPGTKFTTAQLKQLRRASLARLICDNTGINSIQKFVFWDTFPGNKPRNCNGIGKVKLNAWKE